MLSKISSHRMSRLPNFRTMYLLAGNISVPKNFRRPSGKSMYSTGVLVSSCDRAPCWHAHVVQLYTEVSSCQLYSREELRESDEYQGQGQA